jgi:hypothetical protein
MLSAPSHGLWLADVVQCFLIGVVLSYRAAVVGGAFLGGVKPSGLDIYRGVDRLGT